MTRLKTRTLLTTAIGISMLALSACQSATTSQMSDTQLRTDKIAQALARAENKTYGESSLKALENRYKQSPDNELIATEYAYALRKNDYLAEAIKVLTPFARDENSSAATKSEYAALQLAQGNYKQAEEYAQKAVLKDENYDRAYHNLAIALDAQGKHEQAERAFRKGLDLWQGDPTSIMNNLALNLTAQGHLEEASEILQKAKAIAPDKPEIERNLRIVTALIQSDGAPAPKPQLKPDIKETNN
ncbi:MAG: tetratricopeptide repeat protein [Alphaproteobacteria bacterium]|nr:tetratricopeptide repeat protein [Alphaproteobacteria bacterium]